MSTSSFPPLPSLSNSKFETYRLSPLDTDVQTTTSPLPGSAVTQGRVHGKTLLSAKEVGSRIKHDHLGVGWGGWFCWVDEEWDVWAVKIGEDFVPRFSPLGSLPTPIAAPSAPPAEYPSICSLSPTTYILSDGHGAIYPLRVRPSPGSLDASFLGPAYELSTEDGELRPFKVEWVGGERNLLISSVRRERLAGGGWGKEKGWEVMLVRFGEDWAEGLEESLHDSDSDEKMKVEALYLPARKLQVLWTLKGEDVPLYAHFASNRFLLGSSSHYSLPASSQPQPPSSSPPPTSAPETKEQARFSWTQTSSTVSLTFPSLASKPTAVSLLPRSLSISPPPQGFSSVDKREWWDAIKPSESTWIWEDGALVLELEKQNAQTRWPSLFSSGARPAFDDVPETLSVEQSAAIAENLAKFTSSFEGVDAGLGEAMGAGGISSLMRDEMDIDEDEDGQGEGVGGRVQVRWSFVQGKEEGMVLVGGEEKVEVKRVKGGEVVLGSEMSWGKQGGFGKQEERLPEVLVKGSLDAFLFSPPTDPTSISPFLHTKTFPALSYVLASKRDVKYILHTPTSPSHTSAVLVFSSPTTNASQGDLFIYYDAEGNTKARSGVVKLGGGDEEGALLGVKGVIVGGERVVVALCERRVVVVRGLI